MMMIITNKYYNLQMEW